jgi:hypothetical protein
MLDETYRSDWLANNEHEPRIGGPDCPRLPSAEMCGTRGLSLYTPSVGDEYGSSYEFKFEGYRAYYTRN